MTPDYIPPLIALVVIGGLLFLSRLGRTRTYTYRSKAGVRIIETVSPYGTSRRVDLDDPQTKEVFRKELEKWRAYELKDGRIVRRKE